ncbi:ABC transporter ATP-binding protein [Tautonia plasticadhaerens]|nr:ABC transporter ATP-binding protein [Tautonia plasticadhaerens]
MPPAVAAREIGKGFGGGRGRATVLKGVSLEIRRGEVVFLVGPSGSGKSTLLSLIGGIMTPDQGSLTVLGQDTSRLDPARRADFRRDHLGFIFQTFHLMPTLSALDNVRLALAMRGISRRESTARATALLGSVGLSHRAGLRPGRLSTGECQRVAVARALAGDPELVLADEPTASLDAENGQAIMHLLTDLVRTRGATLLIVTHDNRIFPFADRILRLEGGRVVGSDGPGGGDPPEEVAGVMAAPDGRRRRREWGP